jgi:hypothetical protein
MAAERKAGEAGGAIGAVAAHVSAATYQDEALELVARALLSVDAVDGNDLIPRLELAQSRRMLDECNEALLRAERRAFATAQVDAKGASLVCRL